MLTALFSGGDLDVYLNIADLALALLLAVAALTPTDKDDTIATRAQNLVRALRVRR